MCTNRRDWQHRRWRQGFAPSRIEPPMLPLARALIRRRWIVIVLWTILGGYATLRAPRTPELLSARGGSFKVTEADEVSALIRNRFAAPLGETFALTLQAPVAVDSGRSGAVFDSIVTSLR